MDLSVPARVEACIYRVEGADGRIAGAAFALARDGLLATCTHVLDDAGVDASSINLVRFATGEEVKAEIIDGLSWGAEAEDVTFLRIIAPESGEIPYLEASSYAALPGASLYAYGFPEGRELDGMPGRCRVVGPSREAGQPLLAISSGEVSVGFSGGPAVDEESGLVVGMVTSIAIADRYGKNAKSAFLTPASALIQLNPMAAVGTDRIILHYRKMMRSRGRNPTYFIPGLTGTVLLEFVPPALRDDTASHIGSSLDTLLTLEEWLSDYDEPGVRPVCLIGDAGSGKSATLRALTVGIIDHGLALPVLVSAKALLMSAGDLSERLANALRLSAGLSGDLNLPDDFFSRWPSQFAQRFILLIDGCDEITDLRERNLFLNALRIELAPYLAANGHSLIVASREVPELRAFSPEFRRLVVEPLPDVSIKALVELVLDARADEFNAYLARFENRTLLSSPLVLQLLLALFLAGKLRPTPSLVSIYEAYFGELEAQWRRRGLESMAGIAGHALDVLSIIAWHELRGAGGPARGQEAAAEFLLREQGLGPVGAIGAARELLDFLCSEAGIARAENGSLRWVHSNFRDFLAARAICRLGLQLPGLENRELAAEQARVVLQFWDSTSEEIFARFVLAMSSEPKHLAGTVETLMQRGNAGLCFLARALSDGTPISGTLRTRLAEGLFANAAKADPCALVFGMQSEDPVHALQTVVWMEPFFSVAATLFRKPVVESDRAGAHLRREVSHAMLQFCSKEQLASLEADSSLQPGIRDILNARKSSN